MAMNIRKRNATQTIGAVGKRGEGMKQLTISRARTLGKDTNAKGIVILAFGDDGEFQACSYGRTKQDCGQLGKWLDGIYDAIESGKIEAPFLEQQSPERLTRGGESAPVSGEGWIPAGAVPPFVQVGMVVRHKDGGPTLAVDEIYDLERPQALLTDVHSEPTRLPCLEIRAFYRLVEPFHPEGGVE